MIFVFIADFEQVFTFWLRTVNMRFVRENPIQSQPHCNAVYSQYLTLSCRRPLSYRNQSIDLLRKSVDWFLYDNGLRHERVKQNCQILVMSRITFHSLSFEVDDCSQCILIIL